MTTQVRWLGTTIQAGEDLTAASRLFKAIQVNGTISALQTTAIGLLQSKGKTGEGVTVGYQGEMKGYAGAAIAANARLTVTTSGFLITQTSGNLPVGKALEAANSGDLFRGIFDFAGAGIISI